MDAAADEAENRTHQNHRSWLGYSGPGLKDGTAICCRDPVRIGYCPLVQKPYKVRREREATAHIQERVDIRIGRVLKRRRTKVNLEDKKAGDPWVQRLRRWQIGANGICGRGRDPQECVKRPTTPRCCAE